MLPKLNILPIFSRSQIGTVIPSIKHVKSKPRLDHHRDRERDKISLSNRSPKTMNEHCFFEKNIDSSFSLIDNLIK
jgi:hypothetical protein